MKKKQIAEADPLDREIDFSKGRPNPYFVAAVGPKVIRVLESDLAEIFPDSVSVNEALRTLVRLTADVPRRVSAKTAAAPKSSRKKAHS
jgi:hypothetical protein